MYKNKIFEKLQTIIHPEYKADIITLGFVEFFNESENHVEIRLKLKRINDPFSHTLKKLIELAIKDIVPSSFQVNVIVEGKEKEVISEINALEKVKNIIAIASGKGGVGKSTTSANFAIALSKKGYKVGLLDADIYGPSIPKMFGLEDFQPEMQKIQGKDLMIPADKFGIKLMSIGFFFDPSQALIWRGPMATSAIKNLINDTLWGELDFLLIDLPPGTNDIHLTLVQSLPLNGAVIVTTPQMVALADAIKGINMFTNKNIDVPVIGIIENMSWFEPSDSPDKKYFIFGKNGGKTLSSQFNVPLIGQIPIDEMVCESGDMGRPIVLNEKSNISNAFVHAVSVFEVEFEKVKKVHVPKIVEITKK